MVRQADIKNRSKNTRNVIVFQENCHFFESDRMYWFETFVGEHNGRDGNPSLPAPFADGVEVRRADPGDSGRAP
jgi:hypothetical protein